MRPWFYQCYLFYTNFYWWLACLPRPRFDSWSGNQPNLSVLVPNPEADLSQKMDRDASGRVSSVKNSVINKCTGDPLFSLYYDSYYTCYNYWWHWFSLTASHTFLTLLTYYAQILSLSHTHTHTPQKWVLSYRYTTE